MYHKRSRLPNGILFLPICLTVLTLVSELAFCTGVSGSLQIADNNPLTITIINLLDRPSRLYCACNNVDGRDLVFDLVVQNDTEIDQTIHVFVWASADDVNPPERGLWPLSAVETSLTENGILDVKDPIQGMCLRIPSNEMKVLKEISILQPMGWWKGRKLTFSRILVQIWSPSGILLVEKSFCLEGGQATPLP